MVSSLDHNNFINILFPHFMSLFFNVKSFFWERIILEYLLSLFLLQKTDQQFTEEYLPLW